MLNSFPRPIYVAATPVDMRKSFDGLAALVKHSFHKNPLDGKLFEVPFRADELPEAAGAGLAIGSGQMEGVCKNLIGARPQQTGTKWRHD